MVKINCTEKLKLVSISCVSLLRSVVTAGTVAGRVNRLKRGGVPTYCMTSGN